MDVFEQVVAEATSFCSCSRCGLEKIKEEVEKVKKTHVCGTSRHKTSLNFELKLIPSKQDASRCL